MRSFRRERIHSMHCFSLTLAIGIVAVLCFSSVVQANGVDLDGLLQTMQKHREKVDTYKARFVPTKTLELFGQQKSSSGVVLYKAPRQMIWKYTAPDRTQMRINSESVSFYFPELEQIEIHSSEKGRGASFFFAFEATVDELKKNFSITDYSVFEGMLKRMDLSPKSDTVAPGLQSIILWLRTPDYLPEKILIREVSGDATEIELSDISVNIPVTDKELNFDAPEGTEIIRAGSGFF